jgi:hypothetical protein
MHADSGTGLVKLVDWIQARAGGLDGGESRAKDMVHSGVHLSSIATFISETERELDRCLRMDSYMCQTRYMA